MATLEATPPADREEALQRERKEARLILDLSEESRATPDAVTGTLALARQIAAGVIPKELLDNACHKE